MTSSGWAFASQGAATVIKVDPGKLTRWNVFTKSWAAGGIAPIR